jgi:hypothetical protein
MLPFPLININDEAGVPQSNRMKPIARFSLEDNRIPAAANSRGTRSNSAAASIRSPLKAFAPSCSFLHTIALRDSGICSYFAVIISITKCMPTPEPASIIKYSRGWHTTGSGAAKVQPKIVSVIDKMRQLSGCFNSIQGRFQMPFFTLRTTSGPLKTLSLLKFKSAGKAPVRGYSNFPFLIGKASGDMKQMIINIFFPYAQGLGYGPDIHLAFFQLRDNLLSNGQHGLARLFPLAGHSFKYAF